jgi:hypothetical protein
MLKRYKDDATIEAAERLLDEGRRDVAPHPERYRLQAMAPTEGETVQ